MQPLPSYIYGNASQNPLRTRGVIGSDGQGNDGDLYLQYGSTGNIYLGKDGSGCIGNPIEPPFDVFHVTRGVPV